MRRLHLLTVLLAVAGCDPGPPSSSAYRPYPTGAGGGQGSTADGGWSSGTGGGFGGGAGGGVVGVDGGCGVGVDDTPVVSSTMDPLPITGSTVIASRRDPYAIVVNADVATVYFVHLPFGTSPRVPSMDSKVSLGGWPFKPVEDDQGRIHVLLRGTGDLATIDRSTSTVRKVAVCANPRGLAAVPGADLLRVVCAEGALVNVRASDGAILSRSEGPKDLRDVIVQGAKTYATTFRSAELFELLATADGGSQFVRRGIGLPSVTQPDGGTLTNFGEGFRPTVAWKTAPVGDSLMMLHEAAQATTVSLSSAGCGFGPYGGSSMMGTGAIVKTAITAFFDPGDGGQLNRTPQTCSGQLPTVLAADLAVSADGGAFVIAGAGSYDTQLYLAPRELGSPSCTRVPVGFSIDAGFVPRPLGVAISNDDRVLVFTDEPALMVSKPFSVTQLSVSTTAISLSQAPAEVIRLPVTGPFPQPRDTGHRLFHDTTKGRLACASCHPEGQDDGNVWSFEGIGTRRTQNLAGGIGGTAPFHWDGDMTDFKTLMDEVMTRRMSGFTLDSAHQSAVLGWINSIKPARAPAKDADAAARGKALFESTEVGCASCHSGAKFTNNSSADVGTGKAFQVPTLMGLGTRGPFMHDGCAKTLTDRFGPCGGGAMHGSTSQLTAAQIHDLVSYLETL